MISYQVEDYEDILDELLELYPLHYEEVGMDKEHIPLDPDIDQYIALQKVGMLHILTVRDGRRLVGYHKAFLCNHIHFKSTQVAYTDLYFLLPEYRKGFVGVNLFKEVERLLKEMGIKKIYTMTKVKKDNSALFKRLGYTKAEYAYTKYIGED